MPTKTAKARARRRPTSDHGDQVSAYAKAVLAGEIVAGRLVRLACERHLRDLERRDLVWDLAAAQRAIGFFRDVLCLNGGEFEGVPFALQPWQAFIVGSLFGWKGLDGYRRFRVAYVEIAKGNGKSPLAAGIGLYMMVADNEARAEVYAAAVDKDQAKILFRDAVAMVNQSPELDSRITRSGGPEREWNLAHMASGSFMRPISSEAKGRGKSGPRPHCALIDELHEHPTPAMVEFMRAGTKGRTQALIFEITNSGFDRQSICWQHHEYSEKVLTGALEDDARFAYVCTLDEGDDPMNDEACWPKVNPNLGVSITVKYLRERVTEARGMPGIANIVARLNFCVWTEQANRWLSLEVWDRNDAEVTLDDLAGQECFAGGDLGMTDDLCSVALIFPRGSALALTGEGDLPAESVAAIAEPWPLHIFSWMPQEAFDRRVKEGGRTWSLWREKGWLTVTPGAVTDYAYIRRALTGVYFEEDGYDASGRPVFVRREDPDALALRFNIRQFRIDRWNATYLNTQLQEDGLEVVLMGQGFQDMSAPTKWFGAMLKAGKFAHGGQGLARWQATNVAVATDASGNMKPDKDESGDKIDGIVASVEALAGAMVRQSSSADTATGYML